MKPKEYVKNFDMQSGKFDSNGFIREFTVDFISSVEFHKLCGVWNYTKFQNCVSEIRQKWDGISNKISGGLPEKLWKYFYAREVVPLRDQEFGDYLKNKKKEYEDKKAFHDYVKYGAFKDFFGDAFFSMMTSMFAVQIPHDSFTLLQLKSDASIDDVKESFKVLAFQHHPDKGGDANEFRSIVEAKNRCLSYIAEITT
jgi:hypothetical protein